MPYAVKREGFRLELLNHGGSVVGPGPGQPDLATSTQPSRMLRRMSRVAAPAFGLDLANEPSLISSGIWVMVMDELRTGPGGRLCRLPV